MGGGLPLFVNLKRNKYKETFKEDNALNRSRILRGFCVYRPAVSFLVGTDDDGSVSIRIEACGCQAGSWSSNVSKGHVSLAALSSSNMPVLLV